ncbi:DUF3515 family protein [Microbacterium nymphoidis]|uniref:DUF3515 family protein n=1 Tax=Microbacterium nymphoidis TaxID=2898586 RepID=UPI001E5A8B26|nr:DUF3515 family protein [Microbacterium nymphoidis]MCD2497112.1 DUF3515 family protein [Microbacterium nymphoidis]
MSLLRRIGALVGASLASAALVLSLTGCSQTISIQAAPNADDPQCAAMMAQLNKTGSYDTIAGLPRVWTDAQSTAAWGSKAEILMACGVEVPMASTTPCQTIAGIDWLVDSTDENHYRVTTFGRQPAVQLFISSRTDGLSPTEVLDRFAKPMLGSRVLATCTERPTS